jgi:hypothetical protein
MQGGSPKTSARMGEIWYNEEVNLFALSFVLAGIKICPAGYWASY